MSLRIITHSNGTDWCVVSSDRGVEFVGTIWDCVAYVRQASGLPVLPRG